MYTIEGHDDRGAFNVQRKYMDVYALRDMLVLRWPGCYVPMTPEKKLFDTDIKFIQRRIIALNIFLRRLTKFPHLYQLKYFFIPCIFFFFFFIALKKCNYLSGPVQRMSIKNCVIFQSNCQKNYKKNMKRISLK